MARARNIKPGFFRNADLVELPVEARLLFIGIWTIADRAGRLEDRPKQIKMELFPADNMDCDGLLEDLASIGMVARYEVDGKRYLQVTNFVKHQNPHRDEKASTLPAMVTNDATNEEDAKLHDASTVQTQCDSDANTMAIGLIPESLIPESLNLNPEEKNTAQKPRLDDYSEEFISAWTKYPSRPGANKSLTFKAWTARINEGVSADSMIAGVVRYSAYCKAAKTEPNFIKQASSFFGPHRHFESDWSIPAVIPQHKTPAPENFAAKDYGIGGRL